jgi:deoxyadenosine/deoxycytidine kinase
MIHLIVEGLIGAGKSTLLSLLSKRLHNVLPEGWNVAILYENVDEWIHDGSLAFSYENPKLGVFPLQIKSMYSKYQMLSSLPKEQLDKTIVCMERSLYSAHHIFGEIHYEDQHLTPHEWSICSCIYDMFHMTIPVNYCFFLDVSPETANQRQIARNREAEKSISMEYMRELYAKYKEHFPAKVPFPCFSLDGNGTTDSIVSEMVAQVLTLLS